jgi:hypothetical protein
VSPGPEPGVAERMLGSAHMFGPRDGCGGSRAGTENKYEVPFSGPHKILEVNTNGTVRSLRVGSVTDMVNVCRIEPYKEASGSIHEGECNMRLSEKRSRAHD